MNFNGRFFFVLHLFAAVAIMLDEILVSIIFFTAFVNLHKLYDTNGRIYNMPGTA